MSIQDAIAQAAAEQPTEAQPTATVPKQQLHIDGDYLAYYASGKDDVTAGEARINALDLIETFRNRTGSDKVIMHNTVNGSHKGERYLCATVKPYQGQRKGGDKPKNHPYLQNWLQSYEGDLFFVKNWLTREADDGIAVCSHYAIDKQPNRIAIATADKDMRMLPGLHITWRARELVTVNPGDYDVTHGDVQYGLKFFFQQMLMGDGADYVPGLEQYRSGDKYKNLGPKTAVKLLEDCNTVAEAAQQVEDLYFLNYDRTAENFMSDRSDPIWADRLAEQAALLWMRCGIDATVDDFVAHAGYSKVPWSSYVQDAAQRLVERVADARATISAL